MVLMKIKDALGKVTERTVGTKGGSEFVTLHKGWAEAGDTVVETVKDEYTIEISRNKKLFAE